jgi:hypothetical protein
MVQPYLSAIESQGEVALVFIGGAYSHSVRRGALLKHPGMIHEDKMVPLNIRHYEATAAERALAKQALSLLPDDWPELLYARVDLAPGPAGKPLILEVELTEPSLFLSFCPAAVEELAKGIVSTLADE